MEETTQFISEQTTGGLVICTADDEPVDSVSQANPVSLKKEPHHPDDVSERSFDTKSQSKRDIETKNTGQENLKAQLDLMDHRPRRGTGPNSDIAIQLAYGRINELKLAQRRLEEAMQQTTLDLGENSVTETRAHDMYNLLVKLCRVLRERLIALRYVKQADPYESSCAGLMNDCDVLVRRLSGIALLHQSELLTQQGTRSGDSLSKVRSETHLQSLTLQRQQASNDRISEKGDMTHVSGHTRQDSHTFAGVSGTARSNHTQSSSSSHRRIIQSQMAALQVKRQAITRVAEMQRQQDELQNQMELEMKQRRMKEEIMAVQRKLEIEIEETKRQQELERRVKQMKAEEEEVKMQTELDAATAAMIAFDEASQFQEVDSVLSSLPKMNPIHDLYINRLDDFADTDRHTHGFVVDTKQDSTWALKANQHMDCHASNEPLLTNTAAKDERPISRAKAEVGTQHLEKTSTRMGTQHYPGKSQKKGNDHVTSHEGWNQQLTQGNSECALGLHRYSLAQQPQNTRHLSPTHRESYAGNGQTLSAYATPFQSRNTFDYRMPPLLQTFENTQQQMPSFYGPHQYRYAYPNGPNDGNLAKSIADALAITRLPVPKPTVFKGDPLQFPAWFAAFSHLVGNNAVGTKDKMLILRDFIDGPARAAVGDLYYDLGEDSYNSALEILKRRFGEDYAIAEAMKDKLAAWPDVKDKDVISLRDFADYVRQCHTMSRKVTGLSILEDPAQIRSLVRKLPDRLSISWGHRVADHKSQRGVYPPLADFVKYLERQSEALKEADLMSKTKKTTVGEFKNFQKNRVSQAFSTTEICSEQNAPDGSGIQADRIPYGQRGKCLFCGKDHFTSDCEKLAKKPFEERKEFAKKKRLCFKCLRGSHAARGCFAKVSCETCKSKHVTIMHDPNYTPIQQWDQRQNGDSRETTVKMIDGDRKPAQGAVKSNHRVEQQVESRLCSLFMPVYVSAKAEPDNEILVYAMLDTMSDTSFIIEPVMEKLNLTTKDSVLTLRTLTTDRETIKCKSCTDLCVRAYDSDDTIEVPMAYSQRKLSVDKSQIPTRQTVHSIPHLRHLRSKFHDLYDAPIGLLLGVNVSEALRPLEVECGEPGQPYAQRTKLGWGVVGIMTEKMVVQEEGTKKALCFRTKDLTNDMLIASMERDFACPDDSATSQEDIKFIQILSENIILNEEGHYQMPLPFKDGEPSLPDNRYVALRRLISLKQRFLTNPEHFRLYKEFMHQMLGLHDAERVDDKEVKLGKTWYIPHHGVYNPNKPGKVRVVFDCAAKCQDVSLNDFLLSGPDLLNSLVGVLCRFRLHPVALSCDVERMFHQFHVAPNHRDYLRFLWWPDDDLNKRPVDFRMRVHLFGAASSPGCANFALKRLASDFGHINPDASRFIQNDFYVDDGLHSCKNEADAIKLLEGARDICEKGNLRLHKIASNSHQVITAFSKSEIVSMGEASKHEELGENSIERALGLRWNLCTDTLHFLHAAKETPVTKRGVLSTVASIFDPLGLVSPIILKGRQILQEACRKTVDWDEQLPPALLERWNSWLVDLKLLSLIQIPRCYFTAAALLWTSVELHHFSDASTKGYGECSYIRLIDCHGNPHCLLVMAKSKVTPLRSVTIPRLELQAAVLAVKIARFLDKEFSNLRALHHFWTDSRVVLGYIYNETRRFHVFVANRLQQIREFSQPQQWSHGPIELNPADHASRGLSVEEMKNSNWQSGPEFLREKTIIYNTPDVSIEDNDKEVKAFRVHEEQGDIERLIKRFSTLENLLRVVARIMTWLSLIRRKRSRLQTLATDPLEDRESVFKKVVRNVQNTHYPPQSRSNHQELKQLDPFTDEEGMLRVGGRLYHSAEKRRVKNPLIIPRNSHLAMLLARYYHKKVGHQGRTTTMGALQSNGLWVCGARRVISAMLHACVHCTRLRGRLMEQKMSDLPPDRTEIAPPFTNTGLDCFGPFLVKYGRSEVKRYGLIFTCLVSRAVHLEVLEDMTTDAFICGLRRFIAIRGNVRLIRCDRGTNFIGAVGELLKARREMNENKIIEQMVERNCNFSFNPPSASHFGGVWERLIGIVRQVLSGLLHEHGGRLTSDTLSTLFHEVATIINNRPLCVAQLEDSTACEPLTPNHLLTLKPEPIFPPPGDLQREDLYSRKRWRRVQYLVEQFWNRWKKEYLPTLQPRRKWYSQRDSVTPGMVVLMSEEGAPRGTWKMARVEKTYPSDDGLVRSVQLKLATVQKTTKGQLVAQTTFMDRPVHKLVPLNLHEKG